jgi:hypothetical protein
MSPEGSVDWPAFRDAWLSVAHGLAQGGRHAVLLAPFTPEQLEVLPARRWISAINLPCWTALTVPVVTVSWRDRCGVNV